MKEFKKITALLICLVAFICIFVSCNPNNDIKQNDVEEVKGVFASLSEEEKTSIKTIGDPQAVYQSIGKTKFYDGQTVSSFSDADGKVMDLEFNAYLVEYKSLSDKIEKYVNKLDYTNAKRHQRYADIQWNSKAIYVEYATYSFKDSGKPCYREVRVFDGDFMEAYNTKSEYYAKSILFDPTYSYDLSRMIDIASDDPIKSYNPKTGVAKIAELVSTDVVTEYLDKLDSRFSIETKTNGKVAVSENSKGESYIGIIASINSNLLSVKTIQDNTLNFTDVNSMTLTSGKNITGDFKDNKTYVNLVLWYDGEYEDSKNPKSINVRLITDNDKANNYTQYTDNERYFAASVSFTSENIDTAFKKVETFDVSDIMTYLDKIHAGFTIESTVRNGKVKVQDVDNGKMVSVIASISSTDLSIEDAKTKLGYLDTPNGATRGSKLNNYEQGKTYINFILSYEGEVKPANLTDINIRLILDNAAATNYKKNDPYYAYSKSFSREDMFNQLFTAE